MWIKSTTNLAKILAKISKIKVQRHQNQGLNGSGGLLGRPGGVRGRRLGAYRARAGHFGISWKPLWTVLGRPGAALERLERVLAASWTHLRASWRPLSVTRGNLGASLKHLGCDIRRKLELN